MFRAVISATWWVFMTLSCALMFPLALVCWAVTAPFDPRLVALHRFTSFWASMYTWLNPAWPVRVIDRHKIRPDQTYVMVANHQSLLDILVLFRLFAHFKWVSKIENFKIPFVGWNMYLNRYIELRRGDRASIMKMLRGCRDALNSGNSIMMFPEGTRSANGRLKKFKPGAFELAKDTRLPLLPIVVRGTASALPKKGLILQGRHQITIQVLDEIPHESFADEAVDDLTDRVHALFASHLSEQEPEKDPPPRV